MGNVLTTVKRFLGNKNTVTILGVLLGILVLYVFYNYRVKQATTPVSVPYAKVDLSSRTLITEDMIGFMEVSSSVVKNSPNLITDRKSLLDHYVAFGTTIPANSLFYTSQILDKNKMPDSAFANIPDGYTIYSLGVDLHSTYGNSIYPDNYIDLYFKAVDDTGVVIIPPENVNDDMLVKLQHIENQEDIWFDCLDRYKWNTYEIVCLKKYLKED